MGKKDFIRINDNMCTRIELQRCELNKIKITLISLKALSYYERLFHTKKLIAYVLSKKGIFLNSKSFFIRLQFLKKIKYTDQALEVINLFLNSV